MGKSKSQEKREEVQTQEGETPEVLVLHYENSQRIDLNGKVHEGTVLSFDTPEETAEARRIIFEAHGVSPVE